MMSRKRRLSDKDMLLMEDSYGDNSKLHHSLIIGEETPFQSSATPESESLDKLNVSNKQIMLLIQNFLNHNGYTDIANEISGRTGIPLEHEGPKIIAAMICRGEFSAAMECVEKIFTYESSDNLCQLMKYILVVCFIEMTSSDQITQALQLVRRYSNRVKMDFQQLHHFVRVIMETGNKPLELMEINNTDKEKLIINLINRHAPITVSCDPDRLTKLMKYATMYQFNKCCLHSQFEASSLHHTLFKDHFCNPHILPSRVIQTIDTQRSSLWDAQFSHNGKYFAVCGKECSVTVYQLTGCNNLYMKFKSFSFDTIPISFKWSPNDSSILVVTTTSRYVVFTCKVNWQSPHDIIPHILGLHETATAIEWLPDSDRFVVATIEGNIYVSDVHSTALYCLHGYRALSLVVLNEEQVVFSDSLKRIITWNMIDDDIHCIWESGLDISGIYICPDKQNLIISVNSQGSFLFSLKSCTVLKSYNGAKNQKSILRCSFMPGNASKIFCCGSEDGNILYWHIDKEQPIAVIQSSIEESVTSVSWSPSDAHTLISSHNNGLVNVWKSNHTRYHPLSENINHI